MANPLAPIPDYYSRPNGPDSTKEHFLLDTETLSLKPNAAITEIAVIKVSDGTTMDWKIDPGPYNLSIFDISADTVQWHDDKKGGYSYLSSMAGQQLPSTVAQELVHFLESQSEGKQVILWTQGTDFDIPILRNFLEAYDLKLPLRHDDVRDFRTLAKLFPEIPYKKGNHSAFDDVIKMNVHMQKIINSSSWIAEYLFGRD